MTLPIETPEDTHVDLKNDHADLDQSLIAVKRWLFKKEKQIINIFAQLPNAEVIGKNEFASVFVPGTRKDAALLVAHADTVWQDTPHLKILYQHGLLYSGTRFRGLNKKDQPRVGGLGIGADDRAGVAILWELREMGHSLLITGNEECGCLGSSYLMADPTMAKRINDHSFAVQFDRKGRNDLVFYNVGTDEFAEYCATETGYVPADGSYTDICVLCETICGVNISVGYKNEHTSNEILNLRWWANTLEVAKNWLSKPLQKFSL